MEMKIKHLNFRDIANFGQEIFSTKWYSDLLNRLAFSHTIKHLLHASEISFLGIDYRELRTYPHKTCLGTYILDKMSCSHLSLPGRTQ